MTKLATNIRIAIALAAVVLAMAAIVPVASAQSVDLQVQIDQFIFAPQRITVKTGTTVTWVNDDDIPHTVVSNNKLFKSKTLDTKDSFSFTFVTPGTYDYFCSLHPHMTGTVVVESVFSVPGLGRYFIDAANNRDYFLILGITAFGALSLMIANLVVDVLYAFLDPRIRYE